MKDRIEDELAWLRITYALTIAADISLIGWLAASYSKAPLVLIGLGVITSFALQGLLAWIVYLALKRENVLEDL